MKPGNIYKVKAETHESTYAQQEYVVKSVGTEPGREASAAKNDVLIVYACQDTATIDQGALAADPLVGHIRNRSTAAKISTDPSIEDLIEKWENEGGF